MDRGPAANEGEHSRGASAVHVLHVHIHAALPVHQMRRRPHTMAEAATPHHGRRETRQSSIRACLTLRIAKPNHGRRGASQSSRSRPILRMATVAPRPPSRRRRRSSLRLSCSRSSEQPAREGPSGGASTPAHDTRWLRCEGLDMWARMYSIQEKHTGENLPTY